MPSFHPKTINGRVTLDLSNQGLTSLPDDIFAFTNVQTLDLQNNDLQSIPPKIKLFPELEILYLSDNPNLKTVPTEIGQLANLKDLRMSNCGIEKFPETICGLPRLGCLRLDKNELFFLSPNIDRLRMLWGLFIGRNKFTEVPEVVCAMTGLKWLGLGPNPIRRVPGTITRLTELKGLVLSGCRFDEFPRQILALGTIEKLYMGQWAGVGKPAPVPDGISLLTKLKFLSLNFCGLSSLPDEIAKMKSLEEIWMKGNNFTSIPPQVLALPNITILDLQNNNIDKLPSAIVGLTKLRNIELSGNPLTYPPANVIVRGTAAILSFFGHDAGAEGKSSKGDVTSDESSKVGQAVGNLSLAEGPADVFLSYQWDHQEQALLLYSRLQERGYSCWMDVKQMGGGDSLYGMIDSAIRRAKVFICCVTPAYSESHNCQNEVALAHNLRRRIIPCLLEKSIWPPPGPMALPFAQILFMNFTKYSSEDPWQGTMFEELVKKVDQLVKND